MTDHKPLTTILGSHTGIPPLAAARLQRWALLLSAYQYDIRYRQSECHGNADAFSRLPIVGTPVEEEGTTNAEVYNVTQLETLPVTYQQLKTATNHDPILGQVVQCIRNGWPVAAVEELKPYVARKLELTLQDDCVLWGTRVVLPKKLQAAILEELHKDHAGICRIKALARSYVWWPGLDREVEQLVKSCLPCQSVRNAPSVAPLHPWVWPAKPWQRIHVDFAGPVEKRMLMVVVDAHSKWPEVIEMTLTTSELTIQALRGLFAAHGLPDQVVSDNGPQFVSKEFQGFMKENGIKHTRCAPYHPSSNGLAERFVQTLKNALRRTKDIGRTFQHRLAGFLLAYRTTPHATTNVAPCELLMNRKIRTRLDLLYPDVESRVAKNVSRQKAMHDVHAKAREFLVGQRVRVRNLRDGPKWVPGVVLGRQGPLSYVVQTTGGEVWKRHVDQIEEVGDPGSVLSEEELIPTVERPTVERPTEEPLSELESTREQVLLPEESLSEMDGTRENTVPSVVNLSPREASAVPLPNEEGTETLPLPSPSLDQEEKLLTPGQEIPPTRRYPQRIRKPPQRY